jgi:hypothetical protein
MDDGEFEKRSVILWVDSWAMSDGVLSATPSTRQGDSRARSSMQRIGNENKEKWIVSG